MATPREGDRLSRGMERIDGLAIDDEALRIFAKLLRVYLERGPEDREGIAGMASIIAAPQAYPGDAQAALDALRESLHSSAGSIDLASYAGLVESHDFAKSAVRPAPGEGSIERIEGYFDSLALGGSTLGQPHIDGDRMRIPVDNLRAPIYLASPADKTAMSIWKGWLEFEGVSFSQRVIAEFIDTPDHPMELGPSRTETDGPFQVLGNVSRRQRYEFDGHWESPAGWVQHWLIIAEDVAFEVVSTSERS